MDGSLFSIQVKCFHLIGFHRAEFTKHAKLFHVLQISCIICISLCLMSEIYFVVENILDVMASAESFGTLSTEIITLSKVITFYIWKENFYQLMDEIKFLSKHSDSVKVLSLKRLNQFDKGVTLTYLTSGMLTGLGYCITPIIINLVNIFKMNHETNVNLPMKAAFPYDVSISPAYELTYATFCCATYVTIFASVGFSYF